MEQKVAPTAVERRGIGANRLVTDHAARLPAFRCSFPAYDSTNRLDHTRAAEYAHLDAGDQTHLDYSGGGLYAESRNPEHLMLLRDSVFGNYHSTYPTSKAMTHHVDRALRCRLDCFNAWPGEYIAILTPTASGALNLVGEAYPLADGGNDLFTADSQNSVNGIRALPGARGRCHVPAGHDANSLRAEHGVDNGPADRSG